jgi:hypothetical protein
VPDYQILFNIAFSAAGFLGGWVLNNMTKAIDRLDKDVRDLPHIYVSKDDFKDMREDMRSGFDKIDNTLNTIFKRLERKEDKN